MSETLRELVDLLPSQSLDLYVQHYEAGEVGGYHSFGFPAAAGYSKRREYCPRCCLGFGPMIGWMRSLPERDKTKLRPFAIFDRSHPAFRIEEMAMYARLDTAALYSECVLALQERDAALQQTNPIRQEVRT